VKSSQQQRPVSTLGFSESHSSPDEVPVEKMSAAHSIVALMNDDEASDGVNDKADIYTRVLKQVYVLCDLYVFYLLMWYSKLYVCCLLALMGSLETLSYLDSLETLFSSWFWSRF